MRSSDAKKFDPQNALHKAMGYSPDKKAPAGPFWVEGEKSPYQVHDITHFPDWRNIIVWDAYFNNMTAGLMIISVICWAFGPVVFSRLMPFALTLALILVCVDFVLLICDLGDSWRFSHSMRVLHFTSPLSVGVWGLACYATCLGIAVVLYWIGIASNSAGMHGLSRLLVLVARPFTVLSFIGAVVVICYKGVVFSCTSQPGVKKARWLSPFMVADALLLGLASYTILAVFIFGMRAGMWLILPLYILLVARCVSFGLIWLDVRARARKIYSKAGNTITMLVVLAFGGAVPAICALPGAWGLLLAALLVLLCGIWERYWLIGLARHC